MDEDLMLRVFQELKEANVNSRNYQQFSLHDTDHGFFEKFGSLLRQNTNIDESILPLAPLDEKVENESISEITSCETADISEFKSSNCGSSTNRTGYLAEDTLRKNTSGMNIDDLYEEIIFEIYNNIGYSSKGISVDVLLEFARDVFKIPTSRHEEILQIIKTKEPPKIRLNIQIIKAENLLPKDSNGLSDPFVTLYLESNASHRYNSSVKEKTLNPMWEEHFSLPIAENPRNEVLIIEIWDFDAAETVKEKVTKILDVKGVKGLSKLMKEIAVTASTGKHDNELIGRASITLKSIPTTGTTIWQNLEKGSKLKSRGSILVNLAISAEKNKQVALQEHMYLLKILLTNELEHSQVAHFWWNGKFSSKAEEIRNQHAMQGGLSAFECALTEWSAYASVHEKYPLNFILFGQLLNTMTPVLKSMQNNNEQYKTFWHGAKHILPSCFSVIKKMHFKSVTEKHFFNSLCEVLDIISKLKAIQFPDNIDIFPKNAYGWMYNNQDDAIISSMDQVLNDSINIATKQWFEQIIECKQNQSGTSVDEDKLQHLIKVLQIVLADLQRASDYLNKIFFEKVQINVSAVLYKYYYIQITEISQPIIEDVCQHITRLDVPEDYSQNIEDGGTATIGTTLFELYLILKHFYSLGLTICPNQPLTAEDFYLWFVPGVSHWLDIAAVKALNRIEKAIELDQLVSVDETVKYTSSAVDTLAIFYQIKTFWKQLDWPDVEGSYTFVAKIIHDICRCCLFYAQRMSRRVESLTDNDAELFKLSKEWCLAINNIDYICQSLPSFIKELGTNDIIMKLGEYRSEVEAGRCAVTIQTVVDNAIDTEKNQILELIEIVTQKMAPSIRRFLMEGAEVLHENSNSMEKLMMYMESSLQILYENLNRKNFGRILEAMWNEISVVLYNIIQSNLEKRRPPVFFKNLRETLKVMVECFKVNDIAISDIQVFNEVDRLLKLHALETSELVHQYYLERLEKRKQCLKSDYGQLTIQVQLTDCGFVLHILNARNLMPMDNNGSCDSFVKVQLLPKNNFIGSPPMKTSTHHKNRFPLFDEHFKINLNEAQKSNGENLVLFLIKDTDYFGMATQHIGESYISFSELLSKENEQIHLELMRPEYTDSDLIRALEHRQGDKQAKEFLKKLKQKAPQ